MGNIGQASLIELDNTFVTGIVFGVIGTTLFTTNFGGKVRGKATSSLERKLGL